MLSVKLASDGEQVIDGVALQLHDKLHQELGPRLLLPISGTLSGPIHTVVELRHETDIPRGAIVVGTVWFGEEQQLSTCPTDLCTGLEGHVRGCRAIATLGDHRDLTPLNAAQVRALLDRFPWLGQASECTSGEQPLDINEDEVNNLCSSLGLDDECADWLKDLMTEEL